MEREAGTASTARRACCSERSRTASSSPRPRPHARPRARPRLRRRAERGLARPAGLAGDRRRLLRCRDRERARARRRPRRRGRVVVADVREWTPAAGAFDLVVVLYLHLPAEERRPILAAPAAGRSGRDDARRRTPLGEHRARAPAARRTRVSSTRPRTSRQLRRARDREGRARAQAGRGRAATRRCARPRAATVTIGIVELRRYTLKPGARETLVELFDRESSESQEALGMSILGTFRISGSRPVRLDTRLR